MINWEEYPPPTVCNTRVQISQCCCPASSPMPYISVLHPEATCSTAIVTCWVLEISSSSGNAITCNSNDELACCWICQWTLGSLSRRNVRCSPAGMIILFRGSKVSKFQNFNDLRFKNAVLCAFPRSNAVALIVGKLITVFIVPTLEGLALKCPGYFE